MSLDRCNQCGEPSTEFREGVCVGCYAANQAALDEHNAAFDFWESLSDAERDDFIKGAHR